MCKQSPTKESTIMSETLSSTWKDYYELCKPNVVFLMLVTSLVGMYMAIDSSVPFGVLIFGNLGIGLCAASAAVVNHLVDEGIDRKMSRTENRPVATGRIDASKAKLFSLCLGVIGVVILLVSTNPLTAALTAASSIGYAFVYTMYLKRATPQNIVIGGLAGAMPPLLGWVAVTGEIHYNALLLVLIIYAWTPPHFWALAIHRKEEYAKAGIPMLPVTHGEHYTRVQIVLYTLLMFAASILPFATRMSGWLYLLAAIVLGVGFIVWAIILMNAGNKKAPMMTFAYSIIYLIALFVVMLIDHQFIAKMPSNMSVVL
ncbi:MAG: heme o synthase [Pseudomonadota bacterium]